DIDGCELFPSAEPGPAVQGFLLRPQLTPEQLEQTLTIENKHKDTVSAARNTNAEGINPAKTLVDIVKIEKNEIGRFTSEHSGIEFILHSNASNPFKTQPDLAVLDDLIHAGFSEEVT